VGGKNKVDMATLRAVFEAMGLTDVATYLNTGNVVFAGPADVATLERGIAAAVGFAVPVLLRTADELAAIVDAIPSAWVAEGQRCEVLFLGPDVDRGPAVLDDVPRHPEVDDLAYVPGAVLWHLERARASRSRVSTIVGTALYARMSMRSAGTVRKLLELATGGGDRGSSRPHPGAGR
jgi:uncharacterized protein (DUF1697 family)